MSDLRSIVPENRPDVIDRMNALLASALYFEDLYKRYHWLVTGPHFLPLHELFDEHMETLEQEIDDIAERIRVLGGEPIWDPAEFAEKNELPEPDRSIEDDLLVAREAFEMEAAYSDLLRTAAHAFEDDLGSQDLVIGYLRKHEKQAWFLREFVKKVDISEYDEETFVH